MSPDGKALALFIMRLLDSFKYRIAVSRQSFGFVHHAIARQFQVSDCSQQTRRYTDKELEKLKDIHRYIHNLLENVNVIHKYTHK